MNHEVEGAAVEESNGGEMTHIARGRPCEVLHEYPHRFALVAQEVIDLGDHEARNVTGTGLVDGIAKAPMVWPVSTR